MATYVQAERPLVVTTPLGKDKLLLAGLSGHEGLSQLFQFRLKLMAENATDVAFDKLLGQGIAVSLATIDGGKRFFHGLCSRVAQGEQDEDFTSYEMELVPQFWLLTKRSQSRIFQHSTVPAILKKVFEGLDVTFELQGSFQPRDYVVQYRETDFNFASRLMEEEGIFYFFKHAEGGHKMVVGNTPGSHSDLPGTSKLIYEKVAGGGREDERITQWEKAQELRSGKFTLWDHSFELPHKHLEAEKQVPDSIQVGSVSHKLKVAGNDKLEVYDFPGEYAQRFDGIDKGGAERPADLQKIYEDNKRTTDIRMQQDAAQSVLINGVSNARNLVSGHKFTLDRHFNANGAYVLTSVEHTASVMSDFRSGSDADFVYHNRFTCIPAAAPFRPLRLAPKPFVQGTQTAVVVGPGGEEIFCDKYGRVKVQFHWDRAGKNDPDSSCWVRVTTLWAGKQWGVIHIPRIGQEVVVAFEEGDPDRPIIVGSVYNAETMPPYELPDNKTQSGVKSRSSLDGTPANFNEFRFEDKKGEEEVYLHAEKDLNIVVENDETRLVGRDRKKTVERNEDTSIGKNRTENVGKNESITISDNRTETVGKDEKILIKGNRSETVEKDEKITINGARTYAIQKDDKFQIAGNQQINVTKDSKSVIEGAQSETINKDRTINVGKKLQIVAGDEIVLKVGAASIIMKKNGDVQIKGKNLVMDGSGKINIKASSDVAIKGSKVKNN